MFKLAYRLVLALVLSLKVFILPSYAFQGHSFHNSYRPQQTNQYLKGIADIQTTTTRNSIISSKICKIPTKPSLTSLKAWGNDDDEETLKAKEEVARLKVLEARRKTIRSTLRSAESLRNFRIMNSK